MVMGIAGTVVTSAGGAATRPGQSNTNEQVVERGARFFARCFRESAGVVRGLEGGAKPQVFRLVKGEVGLAEGGLLRPKAFATN